MGPVKAVTTAFRKTFQYSDRASRSEYWWYVAFTALLSMLIESYIASGPNSISIKFGLYFFVGPDAHPLQNLFSILVLPPFVAVLTRRMHDLGRPGYHALIVVVGLIALILAVANYARLGLPHPAVIVLGVVVVALLLACIIIPAEKGQPGPNRYGPNPLEVTP